MALEFFRRAVGEPRALGVLSASFNPPTCAHLALARAALEVVDEVLFVLPREFPHKVYEGASFDQRMEMLLAATEGVARHSVASSEGGLFVEIAGECREAYGKRTALAFICGADAAERVLTWDYGRPDAVERMLEQFELLVAPRAGGFEAPRGLDGRIRWLSLDAALAKVSATQVRERVRRGEGWEHLVPPAIVPVVRRIYGSL